LKFSETKLSGSYLIELNRLADERGDFARSFCRREFSEQGLHADFVQTNLSRNLRKGTVRGLHYQRPPNQEVKVVQCVRGAVFDVIVDLRQGSSTRGQWFGAELTADAHNMMYIPEGFAHGFQTLQDHREVFYLMGNYHVSGGEGGVRWNDATLAIPWPIVDNVTISDRDTKLPLLEELGWISEDSALDSD